MRFVLNILILLVIAGVCGVALVQYRATQRSGERLAKVHAALDDLHKHAIYHQEMGEDGHSQAGFPNEIRLEWFNENPPVNLMVSGQRPWIDVAPDHDFSEQPPDPVILTGKQAAFWYNPNNGVFRARVEPELTDERTLKAYNEANDTSLASLPHKVDYSRQPLAMRIVPTGSTQHASPSETIVEQVLDGVDLVEPEPEPVITTPTEPEPDAKTVKQRPTLTGNTEVR